MLVVIGLTVNEAVPVEGEKPFPTVGVKTALKLSVPTGNVDVWTWAVPPLTVTGVPMSVVPTSNWTEPVADDGATVAVRVSWVPNSCGLAGEAVNVVVVGTPVTVNDAVPVDPV